MFPLFSRFEEKGLSGFFRDLEEAGNRGFQIRRKGFGESDQISSVGQLAECLKIGREHF
jgi:hypothetical protein